MSDYELISHHLCPYVQRAAIVLSEKGAKCRRTYIDLDAKPEWFLSVSPLGKVPLLRIDGTVVLFESAVICDYLDEVILPRLNPEHALDRAQHRAWTEFASSALSDIYGLETARDKPTYESKRTSLRAKFERLEPVLTLGPYFSGDHFAIVDAAFGPVFRYFDLFDTIAETNVFMDLPRVQAWRSALARRPSVSMAVGPDYGERLRAFLIKHDAHLLRA